MQGDKTEMRLRALMLAALDGSCRTPIAGLARIDGDTVRFSGTILTPDGTQAHEIGVEGPVDAAARLGREAGETLRTRAGAGFFADWA